ncbi:MAG: BlaI/MecI/CopY family transcriptional regulator [Chitinophagales bacterium]|nr:BlaI/MecI/CopY family transcriptional regulator [Chitinophagales bacterium]
MNLTKAELQVMELIWQQEKLFMKDLLEAFPEPKPAPSTLATLLKRMQDKGFVGYTLFGNSREYYALVKKEQYFSKEVKSMIKGAFDNSALSFASFFTTATKLSVDELEQLKAIIDQELKKKRK